MFYMYFYLPVSFHQQYGNPRDNFWRRTYRKSTIFVANGKMVYAKMRWGKWQNDLVVMWNKHQ